MGNFYTFALLELFLHCYTLGKNTLRVTHGQFYPGQIFFTLALLVLLVTNIMSGGIQGREVGGDDGMGDLGLRGEEALHNFL